MNSGSLTADTHPAPVAQAVTAMAFGLSDATHAAWTDAFSQEGGSLQIAAPSTLAEARTQIEIHRCRFAVVALPAIGDHLWPALGIVALGRLPVVAIADGPVDASTLERARQLNISCVLNAAEAPDPDLVARLSAANGWFSSRLRRAPLPDLLQMMGGTEPALVEVSCQHASAVVVTEHLDRSCVGGSSKCSGFHARIFLKNGHIQHVEGTGCEGLEALGRTLELTRGELRVHELYIEPELPNIGLPVSRALLDAAIDVDDRARAEAKAPQTKRRTQPPAWPQPTQTGPLPQRPTTQRMPTLAPFDPAPAQRTTTSSGPAARRIMLPPIKTPQVDLPSFEFDFEIDDEDDATQLAILDLSADAFSVDTPAPDSNSALEKALAAVPGAKRALQTGMSGVVLVERGFAEPELMAGVLSLAAETLEEAATALGWGRCVGWALSTPTNATVAGRGKDGRWLAVEGAPAKYLTARLRGLIAATKGER